jgi:phosphatidate phosphatase PAH1
MRSRVQGLQRIALVYMAVKHAQALAVEQAAASLRETETVIAEHRSQAERSSVRGHERLDAGDDVGWRMEESQRQIAEWNTEELIAVRKKREALVVEATELYRAGRMQLEQMESVLRELRKTKHLESARMTQRESDDRFLARQWWDERERLRKAASESE